MKRIVGIVFLLFSIHAVGQNLKVMTYNIRFDTSADSVNAWPNRKENVFAVLKKYSPDILGVQEALHHQIIDITKALPDFQFVGVGRDDGKNTGEFSAILYNARRFEVLEQNTFWLSETPEKPGSKSWDAAITRVATWALMLDKVLQRKYVVINTHFDHIGADARKKSAELLKTRARELGFEVPVIITGDFNCTPDEEPYKIMTDGELLELADPAPIPKGTFCTFKVNSIPCKQIDYIFVTSEWSSDRYTVIEDHNGKYYPSDHLPVIVTLMLTE